MEMRQEKWETLVKGGPGPAGRGRERPGPPSYLEPSNPFKEPFLSEETRLTSVGILWMWTLLSEIPQQESPP